jgi:hypothetical protein
VDTFTQNLIPFLVFLAILLLLLGIYSLWAESQQSGAEKIKTRIRRLSAAAAEESEARKYVSLAKQEGLSGFDAFLLRVPRLPGAAPAQSRSVPGTEWCAVRAGDFPVLQCAGGLWGSNTCRVVCQITCSYSYRCGLSAGMFRALVHPGHQAQ